MDFVRKTLSVLFLSQVFFAVNASKIYSCTEKNTIALTFDDGPYEYTSELVDLLSENNVPATFFINVENFWKDLATNTEQQKVLKKAYEKGNQIASHTWEHEIPEDNEEFLEMMARTNEWIESIIGERPTYFRAPRGECGEECLEQLDNMGFKTIQWDTDTNDWDISNGVEERVILAKEFLTEEWSYQRSSYLVLMHDVKEHTVKSIVPWIIENKPEGYRFVTVAECLGDKKSMYFSGNAPTEPTSTTTTTTTTTPSTTEVETPTSTIVEENNEGYLVIEDSSKKSGTTTSFTTTFWMTIITLLSSLLLTYW